MSMQAEEILEELGLDPRTPLPGCHDGRQPRAGGPEREVICPATGRTLARVRFAAPEDYDRAAASARDAFLAFRAAPAPRRGELVRKIAEELRRRKPALGRLVSLEAGKVISEGEGEVQEMIDIADFAVGLSRQLHGLTMPSER